MTFPPPDATRAEIEAWRAERLMPIAEVVAAKILHGRCSACAIVGHRANSPKCPLNQMCPKCQGPGHIDGRCPKRFVRP